MAETKIGKYTITGELGKGAMGIVYQGTDPHIGRTLAIKTIRFDVIGQPSAQEEAQKRFMREARSAGNLSHPNIVTIYEVGEDAGMTYIAMEYIEGQSLEEIVASGRRFSPEEVTDLIGQIGSALDYAHQKGVIHRDIKPGNILIDREGKAHIVDFGIARIITSTMTQTSMVMGTPFYMSPEQIAGKKVDGRSDIFSLGTIMYELLTNEKPFPGENLTTVVYKIMNEVPSPPRILAPEMPEGLESIVEKALAKNPGERYQSCKELLEDLKNYPASALPPIISERREPERILPVEVPVPPVQIEQEEILPQAQAQVQPEAIKNRKSLLIVLGSMMGVLIVIFTVVFLTIGRSEKSEKNVPSSYSQPGGEDQPVASLNTQTEYEQAALEAFTVRDVDRLEKILAEGLKLYKGSSKLWVYQAGYHSLDQANSNSKEQAKGAATTAVNLDQTNLDNYFELGKIFQELMRDYAAALEFYQKGEEKGLARDDLSYNIALCLENLKDSPRAINYYERFLKAAPNHVLAADAKTRLAVLKKPKPKPKKPRHATPQATYEKAAWDAIDKENVEKLGQTVETGLRYYPRSSRLWGYKAIYLLQKREGSRYKQLALEAVNQALKLDPSLAVNYAILKPVYSELGDKAQYETRETAYARSHPDLYYRLAKFYESVKEKDEAIHYYERFLGAAPNHRLASDARMLLAKLTGQSSIITVGRTQTLTIDSRYYTFAPAVFISFDNAKIIRLPSSEEELKGATVTADIWVEIRDPEIGSLPGELAEIGIIHPGIDAKVAPVSGVKFESLFSVPADIEWKNVIYRRYFEPGLVFLVRSSSGKIYKVRVDNYNTEQKNMKLSFARLK